jgi:hypothetical protein
MKIAPEYPAMARLESCKTRLVEEHPECTKELNDQYDGFVFTMMDERGNQLAWLEYDVSIIESQFHASMHEICEESAAKLRTMFVSRN